MKNKIIYFLSHPIQYFSPLFRKMDEEFDLEVYYFSDASIEGNVDVGFGQKVKWDIPLLEGYNCYFLKNISSRKSLTNSMWDVINPSVIKILFKNKAPIVIVNGWSYFSTILTIFTAKILGKKIWLRAENPLNQELNKSLVVLFIKKILIKTILFKLVDKFLYIGTQNKNFFQYYGIKDNQLVYTPYSVDNEYFRLQRLNYLDKDSLRNKMGLPTDKTIFLFAGKYIEKKRPLDILKAFRMMEYQNSCVLLMVGEGSLREEMEAYINVNNSNNIILTGFINQSEISKYYSVADVFVMCSGLGETWGLTVNEAMNFSLPIIVSSTAGCSIDLVQHGINGFVFEEGDIKQLSGYMESFVGQKSFIRNAGECSLSIVSKYSIEEIVKNLKAACS